MMRKPAPGCLAAALVLSGFTALAPQAWAQPAPSEPSNAAGRVTNPAPESMSPEIRSAYEMNLRGMGDGIGPRVPLFHSPEVYMAWDSMAKALDKSLLSRKLRELTILTVGATWKSDFEWYAHAGMAKKEGLTDDVIEAIRTGRVPTFRDESERIVYQYSMELQKSQQVSDETYNAARKLLGSKTLVELTVLIGHYTNVAMALNAHKGPLPKGVPPQF